eukprot:1146226-Pelagomonas_calceolata.AAC.2
MLFTLTFLKDNGLTTSPQQCCFSLPLKTWLFGGASTTKFKTTSNPKGNCYPETHPNSRWQGRGVHLLVDDQNTGRAGPTKELQTTKGEVVIHSTACDTQAHKEASTPKPVAKAWLQMAQWAYLMRRPAWSSTCAISSNPSSEHASVGWKHHLVNIKKQSV